MGPQKSNPVGPHLDQGSDARRKILFVLGLIYIICPIDLIPDLIPVVGWLDDVGVLAYLVKIALDHFRMTGTRPGPIIVQRDAGMPLLPHSPALLEAPRQKVRPRLKAWVALGLVALLGLMLLAGLVGAGIAYLHLSPAGQ